MGGIISPAALKRSLPYFKTGKEYFGLFIAHFTRFFHVR
jgi:hypothetical protein